MATPPPGVERFAGLWMDVRVAARSLGRSPAFTAVAVLTLALALGGNAAIYGVARNVFTAPLPFRDHESVVRVRDLTVSAEGERRAVSMSGRNFAAIRDAGVFDGLVAQRPRSTTLLSGGEAERVQVADVTAGWSELLGIRAAQGRSFVESEYSAGEAARVVLISHALWRSRLGGEAGAIGQEIVLGGAAHTVVGVLPEGFRFPFDSDVWTPFRPDETEGRGHDLNVVARLPASMTRVAAQRALERVASDLEAAYPETNRDWTFAVEDARENFVQEEDRIVVALGIAVVLLLLLAAVNVANLLIARLMARHREIGLRAALGASPARRTRPLIFETAMLFGAGAVAGLFLLLWTRRWLDVLVPRVLREELDLGAVRFDGRLVGVTLGVALLVAIVFGGLAAAKGAGIDASVVLRGRGAAGPGRRSLQRALVLAQISLALVLLTGAATVLRHVEKLRTADTGIAVEGLYTARADLEASEPSRRSTQVAEVMERLRGAPGIAAVGITTVNPLCCGDWGTPITLEHRRPPADGSQLLVHNRYITPGLMDAMGIPIEAGRDFDSADDADGLPVVIIDRRMADRYWPNEDPIGRRIKHGPLDDPRPWRTIVGVAGTVQDGGYYVDTWYLPYAQAPDGRLGQQLHVMVRPAADPGMALSTVREAFRATVPGVAVYSERGMTDIQAENLSDERMGLTILVLFATFGVLLAAIGIYGLASYFVGDRVQEIGTRIALGARRLDVVKLVVLQAGLWIAVGTAVGVAGGVAVNRVLAAVLPDLQPAGPLLLAATAALLMLVALAATALPALRAARTPPMAALRE